MTHQESQTSAAPPNWDKATYFTAETARLVGLSPGRVRRWLRGYEYEYQDKVQSQSPVVRQRGAANTTYASFLDLVDLLFVKRFLDYGISLQKVRKVLAEAFEILGTHHFARQSFFTDGHQVYLQVKDAGDAILELFTGGQWVIAPIIKQLAAKIEFDSPSGLARRWYPMGVGGLVVLDPLVSFGRPSIVGRGITTANVADFFKAENQQLDAVCSWLDLDPEEVQAAVEFEERLAA